MRVRQLMDGNRGAGRAGLVEVLGPDLVVAAEVVHRYQVGGDLDEVAQLGTDAGEDRADVLETGVAAHPPCSAARPARTARSTSAASASWTRAATVPSTGLILSQQRRSPSMNSPSTKLRTSRGVIGCLSVRRLSLACAAGYH